MAEPVDDDQDERSELHNAAVDEAAALAGRCATVHLPTGRVCRQVHNHDGSCDFTRAEPVS